MRTSATIHYNEVNEVMNTKKFIEPGDVKVGMAATEFVGSDRYAMVVIGVMSPKTIRISHIKDAHIDLLKTDENGIQWLPEELLESYIERDKPDQFGYWDYFTGTTYTFRKNKRWMPKGQGMWETGSISIGNAENYRDPSF